MLSIKASILAVCAGLCLGNSAIGTATSFALNTSATETVTDSEKNITDDLNKMGITSTAYPTVVGATGNDLSFLSLVEWGYQPLENCSSSYCLYLYLYNPACTPFNETARLTMTALGE